MSDFHVVAAALSARREELTGEASPLDYDGARLVLRSLEKAGFSVVSSDGSGPVERIGGQPGPVLPRRFELFRHRDISGVSGTGTVAWGVLFPDGAVALRWPGMDGSTAAWPSLAAVIAVHGHAGATEVRWLDDDAPVPYWPAPAKRGEDR